jgi:hypothetical protein
MARPAAYYMDDLAATLLQTHIGDMYLTQPCIDDVIRTSVIAKLRTARTDLSIRNYFTEITAFGEKWGLLRRALENFKELARGNPAFPVILLWRPSNDHEWASFTNMCKGPTIS